MEHDSAPKHRSRRRFLAAAGKTTAAAIGLQLLPGCIQRALAVPAARVRGTIEDVQHVVILMQENRSFDHYFGTMSGVRGFGDRFTVPLESGAPVWFQSDGEREILPFHLDTTKTTAMRVPGTPHSWRDSQRAWNDGRFGAWPKHKEFQSMGYYQPADVPFQRALAEAFTVCDAHHCSIQAGTLPNRVVFMTGTNVDPDLEEPAMTEERAVVSNGNNRGQKLGTYHWTTYPERLQAAGVRWRVYQDPKDNWNGVLAPWESFEQYRSAKPGDPLYEAAMRAWSLEDLQRDVARSSLPQVSWILPPPVWSEHPGSSSPLQGASFIQRVLDILASNAEVWSKSVLIVTFDENDGLFDHVPPPAMPSYRPDKTLAGKTTLSGPDGRYYHDSEIDGVRALRPYGLGPRVPMYVVSPWSRGGWVNSQVFDHTSTIRFLEARFGVREPNISAWHRAVCGDLTSCFDFSAPDDALPVLPDMSHAPGEKLVLEGAAVAVPAEQSLPRQDSGLRYSRALPYALHVHARHERGELRLRFDNTGRAGAVLHVYDRLHLARVPQRYTVEAGKSLEDSWSTVAADGRYQLLVLGPNGFAREFAGRLSTEPELAQPEVRLEYDAARDQLVLLAANTGGAACVMRVAQHVYEQPTFELSLRSNGREVERRWCVLTDANWYDFSVRVDELPGWARGFAGRLENGQDGCSDPALGRSSSKR